MAPSSETGPTCATYNPKGVVANREAADAFAANVLPTVRQIQAPGVTLPPASRGGSHDGLRMVAMGAARLPAGTAAGAVRL